MRFSALWVLVAAATGVRGDLKVPLCCPVGQIVGGIQKMKDHDEIVCKDTDDPFIREFEPMQNLSTGLHQLKCPNIKYLKFRIDDSTNKTFGDHVKKMLSRPYSKKMCFDLSKLQMYVRFCNGVPKPPTVHWTKTVASGLSVVLLIISALLYSTVKSLSMNPHSPYIVAHNISLAMTYVSRIVLQFIPIGENIPECQYIAFTLQFFTLAAFFWMSAMCLDVHITIRRMLPPIARRSPCNKKFAILSLYAWGIPLLMTTLAICFEFTDAVPIDFPFKPNVARWQYSCFFTGPSRWYLFRWPIAMSVLVSIALFIATAVGLYQHERSVSSIQQNSNFSNDKRCFFLYLKLFVIMGITWGFGWSLDTSIKSYYSSTKGTQPAYFSFVFTFVDIIFCLQGVFIFLLFVCKQRTLKILFEQFQSLRFLQCAARGSDESGSGTGDQGVTSAVSKETIL